MSDTAVLNHKLRIFSVPDHNGDTFSVDTHSGWQTVLYFYPKDLTPGCSMESQNFRDMQNSFELSGTKILGVSRDSVSSHQKFRDKYDLPFPLLADTDEKLCNYFAVIKPKNMFGRLVKGIERSTFLIDQKLILRKEWRKVKVRGHVAEVLKACQELHSQTKT